MQTVNNLAHFRTEKIKRLVFLTVDPADSEHFRQSDDEDAPPAAVRVHQLK